MSEASATQGVIAATNCVKFDDIYRSDVANLNCRETEMKGSFSWCAAPGWGMVWAPNLGSSDPHHDQFLLKLVAKVFQFKAINKE